MDARFVDHSGMRLLRVEMRCPWLDNHKKKDFEKTEKYQPLWWELIKQYPDYKIVQLNVIGVDLDLFCFVPCFKVRCFVIVLFRAIID